MQTLDEAWAAQEVPKRLVSAGGWKRVNAQLRLGASLEVDGVVAAGISFLATVQAEYPDENVTLLLQADIQGKARPFSRIDWRGNPHPNNSPHCREMQFRDVGRTHFHNAGLHNHMDFDELFLGKLNLPIAAPIEPEPAGFQELLALSSRLLHIENLTEIPIPPWQPRKFSI